MATLTITSTPREDAGAKYMAEQYNASVPEQPRLTAMQFALREITQLLDRWADRAEAAQRLTKAQAYQIATPEDQAAVDAILAKYQG